MITRDQYDRKFRIDASFLTPNALPVILRIRQRILDAYELEANAADFTWSDVDCLGPMNRIMNFRRTIPDPTRGSTEGFLVAGVPEWWPNGKAPDTTLLDRFGGKALGDALERVTKDESSAPRPRGVRLNADRKRFLATVMARAGRTRAERFLHSQLRPEKSLERRMLENLLERRAGFHRQRLLDSAYSRAESPRWDGDDRVKFFVEIQQRIAAGAALCARRDSWVSRSCAIPRRANSGLPSRRWFGSSI